MVWKFFAPVYDEVMGDWYFRQWKRCFKEFIQKHKIKYDLVADVACGSGNALLYFYHRGKRVIGIDNSPEMLKVARRKIGKRKIKLMKMDMRSFRLNEPADLITCNFNALNELQNPGELKKAFKVIYDNLKNGGWGIFDMTSIAHEREKANSDPVTYISKSKKSFVIIDEKWNEKNRRTTSLVYNFKKSRHGYCLCQDKYLFKAYFLKDLRKYLRESGFKKVFVYSWMGFLLPAREKDDRYIFFIYK